MSSSNLWPKIIKQKLSDQSAKNSHHIKLPTCACTVQLPHGNGLASFVSLLIYDMDTLYFV